MKDSQTNDELTYQNKIKHLQQMKSDILRTAIQKCDEIEQQIEKIKGQR